MSDATVSVIADLIQSGKSNPEIKRATGVDWQEVNPIREQLRVAEEEKRQSEMICALVRHGGPFWVWKQGKWIEDCIAGRVVSAVELSKVPGWLRVVPARSGESDFSHAPILTGHFQNNSVRVDQLQAAIAAQK